MIRGTKKEHNVPLARYRQDAMLVCNADTVEHVGYTPHERGAEPVLSIAFCDMSEIVTKMRLPQPVVVFPPVVESKNLRLPKSYIDKR